MRRVLKFFISICLVANLLLLQSCLKENVENVVSLKGEWTVVLDSLDQGISEHWYDQGLEGASITLPGTLDEAGLGTPNKLEPALDNYVLSHLTRKHQYIGKAWYQKEVDIPKGWAQSRADLVLERVIWESSVWINGKSVGNNNSLVAPHRYEIGEYLKPGRNIVTFCIDNSNKYPLINIARNRYPEPTSEDMAHAYTNHTQIKWNGILGDFLIRRQDKIVLRKLQLYPELDGHKLAFSAETNATNGGVELTYKIRRGTEAIAEGTLNTDANDGQLHGEMQLPETVKLWDEFNPNIYTFEIATKESNTLADNFGLRVIKADKGVLKLNDQRIFLRGTLECAVFPNTGHPCTDKSSWMKIIKTIKSYGFNHIRFHSWCPPEADFEAADEIGLYLQVELPHWSLKVGQDRETNKFLAKEANLILQEYGNHPSFLFMSLGNELEGDFDFLNSLVADLKAQDSRRLYMTTTFSFQKGAGSVPQPEDDVFVTQWTDKGWIRGQGFFNSESPHFDKDYQKEMAHIHQPVVSHEIGQYCVYPDLTEIPKYTGALLPLNFMAVRNDLEKKGLLKYAPDFTQASGILAALLYKEEIERVLKTPGFDGFQMLQLQDFPGQGTALVGLLNVFWESKGAIDSLEFTRFNGPLVPLLRFEKAVYESGEAFKAQVQIANFKEPISDYSIRWSISDAGKTLAEGFLKGGLIKLGNENFVGEINKVLEVDVAKKLNVKVELEGTTYQNEWTVWVYPKSDLKTGDVVYTRSYSEAEKLLSQGKKVLLNPSIEQIKGVEGRFVPVFWSPVHFPDQPSTMGILCDPKHPALADFPTDFYSNWQWWDLCVQSKSIILDSVNITPIVSVIDNFVTNRKLANVFEAKVGSGSLVFTSIDLNDDLEKRPVARQLKKSLIDYMQGKAFNPYAMITFGEVRSFENEKIF